MTPPGARPQGAAASPNLRIIEKPSAGPMPQAPDRGRGNGGGRSDQGERGPRGGRPPG
jgi:hypothetical protein